LLHTLSGHRDRITALAFSRDGAWLISGSGSIQSSGLSGPYDSTARLWRVDNGAQVRIIEGILSPENGGWLDVRGVPIRAVALAPDGRAAGVITDDGSVRFWQQQLPWWCVVC
jgi:WD40 repeat protein